MPDYSFGGVDFGIDNNDSAAFRSFIQCQPGPIEVARKRFAFPGVDGEFVRHLGTRGRTNTWYIDMIAKAVASLTTFEAVMEALSKEKETRVLVERGATYARAYVESFRLNGPRIPMMYPYAFMQRYEIQFRILP